jgi:hypothetical protein
LRVSLFLTSPNQTIRIKFLSVFRDQFAADTPFHTSSVRELDLQIERARLERDLIGLMSDVETTIQTNKAYDFLTDDETRRDLFRLKDRYLENISTSSDYQTAFPEEFARFLPVVTLLCCLWTAITRHLPRIGTNLRFSFHDFIVIVREGVNQLVPEAEPDAIHRSMVRTVLRHLFVSFNFKDAVFTLFMATFLIRCEEKRSQPSDLQIIIDHCCEELIDSCDFSIGETQTGDPFDHLKFANVVLLFQSIQRAIQDYFYDALESCFPTFKPEQFVQSEPGEPLLIRVSRDNYPLQMLMNYAATQNAIDRLVCFSLTDDPAIAESIVSTIRQLRSCWIVIHYTNPSPIGAGCIAQLLALCAKSDPESRLIFFVSSLVLLPEDLLSARCIAIDDFPSIRAQMDQLCGQYQVRSRGHPVSMRKLSYISGILVSALNFRRFLQPLGFCDSPRVCDLLYKDMISFAAALLKLALKEPPVRNFIEAVSDIALGTFTCDLIDADRITVHIQKMFQPDLLREGYSFVQEDSWRMTTESINQLNNFPTFPTCTFLFLRDAYAVPLRNWTFSRYFSSIFRFCLSPREFLPGDIQAAVDKTLVALPGMVLPEDDSRFNSPTRAILLSEIEGFNFALMEIRRQLARSDGQMIECLVLDRTPRAWLELINVLGGDSLTKFLSFLKDRSFQLRVWLKGSVTPSPVDVRCVSNIRGLLEAYLIEAASVEHEIVTDLRLSVTIRNEKEPRRDALVLANCWVVAAAADPEIQSLSEGDSPFSKIPQLVFEPVHRAMVDSSFPKIPLFKSLPNRELALARDFERIDGEVANFICYLWMDSAIPEWNRTVNGTAIVCHMSEIFQ